MGGDQNTGLSVPIDFSTASEMGICSLGFGSSTTGGRDYRRDIECWGEISSEEEVKTVEGVAIFLVFVTCTDY